MIKSLSISAIISMVFFSVFIYAQEIPNLKPRIEFIQNNNQWDNHIQYRSNLSNGSLWIESGKLTYVFYSGEDIKRIHEIKHGRTLESDEDLNVDGHSFQMSFLNAKKMNFEGRKKRSNYYNYFLGKNPQKWAGNVPAFSETRAKDVWDKIDYRLYSSDIDLKYDFIVHPGGDVKNIQLKFDHLKKIYKKNGNLYLLTSVNELIDMKPLAYQQVGSTYHVVPCEFQLKKGVVSFYFPEGYDAGKKLIIDPKLIFSSYSGSTLDNWGYTATFDQSGNLYAGGIVFDPQSTSNSYPTTLGAFQTTFGSGLIDIGISKFNSTGTSLIYSTYLGGNRSEMPHSLVVNSNNELVVMGTTDSQNYPVTASAYDTTYNISGTQSRTVCLAITYIGSDIVLSKFSSTGDSLLASTYVGGTDFDGINFSNLKFNYGDDVRGEVVVDNAGNCYVATTTGSNDFPVTNTINYAGGVQDAIVFKMNASLSSMIWSTYIGGSSYDAAYSVQLGDSGRAYVAGGTGSSNFPTIGGSLNTIARGGIDGFVSVVNNNGFGLYASTYLGTSSYDQAYFVQLDDSNYVYVTGQTEGLYPVTPPTVYNNANSGQFIHKLTKKLDSTVFSTVFGTGGTSSNVTVDISPSAFLVNQCDHIYVSGWGGNSNYYVTSSTTTGLPTTSGAFKTTTDGNDFYLIVLNQNADSLLYATFFGGSGSIGEHVDGGTSRFDKRGIVYQAVCAGCGSNNSFPASPNNVWSTTNNSGNCNLGVIKFDLSQLSSDIGLAALQKVCIPGSVTFINNSTGGTNYFWDFGDGDTSNLFQPSHTYIDTGDFTVMLIVSDSLSCIVTDTAYINIRGEGPPIARIDSIPVICPGDSIQLHAHGGIKYQWMPSTNLSNDTIEDPFASPPITNSYMVIVGDSCGSDTNNYFAYDTAFVTVFVATDQTTASDNDTVCKGTSIQLMASGGQTYIWTPSTFLNNNKIPNPISTPNGSISYTVNITDFYGCDWAQMVHLSVEDSVNPVITSSPDTIICLGDSILIFAHGGASYRWYPGQFTSDSLNEITWVKPNQNTPFIVEIKSKCFLALDTVNVDVIDFRTEAMPDTFACATVPFELYARPGVKFTWKPKALLTDSTSNRPMASIAGPVTFYVEAQDANGCLAYDSVFIDLRNPPYVSAGLDQLIQNDFTIIGAKGDGSFIWEPAELLDCPTCRETGAKIPSNSILFKVTLTDEYGCVNSDIVLISRLPNNLYVPNTFTPNSDQKNELFRAYGFNLFDFEMNIYNRWGEMIFKSTDIETGWDGTFNGTDSKSGIYVWKIYYTAEGEKEEITGTVSLIR